MRKTLYKIISLCLIIFLIPLDMRAAVELEGYSALRNDANLVHYMRMESATATVGSNMTNQNSVTFVAGQFNNAGNYVAASTQALYLVNDLGITNGDITMIFWVSINSLPASDDFYTLVVKGDGGTFIDYFIVYWNVAGTPHVRFSRTKAGVANEWVDQTQTLTVDTWYQIAMTYDGISLRHRLGRLRTWRCNRAN